MCGKLALSDDILMKIEKPARYIGHEVNSVIKDKDKVSVRFAMCFPDVYEIGMSHLGIQILYSMFNDMDDVWCERVYSPWLDLDTIMRQEHIPLFALESQDPIKEFDFLGITLQYEMCYTNILQILDLADIPFISTERGEDCPIVIGGGPCSYNPEPIADFFDIFYIGEGEIRYRELLNLYKDCKRRKLDRNSFLRMASNIPGMYVPRFYDTKYNADGTIAHFFPTEDGVPDIIVKQLASDMDSIPYPTKPVVPYIKITQDRVVLEIQRGCIRGCRFCQAGQLYRPVRERDKSVLERYAKEMLKNTGHEEITLSSLSSSDYSSLPELIDYLIEESRIKHTNISLPSLRIDAFSLDVMSKVQDVRKSSLTFAPEAGSQRLRNVINKGLTEEMILNGAAMAFEGGWSRVKLYFMLGLPTETEDDINGIAELSNKIAAAYFETVPKESRANGSVQIVASTSFFVPKPFTPFQWASQCTEEEFIEKAYQTRRAIAAQLNQKRIKYNWHEADASVMEGVLARGDRRLGRVILKVYEKGGYFDAWSEYYNHELWINTIEECGLNVGFYTSRKRDADEIFPWDFIDCGVSKEFLLREWNKAVNEQISENCKVKCQGCGVSKFDCGICTEERKPDAKSHDAKSQDSKLTNPVSTKLLQNNPLSNTTTKRDNIRLRIKFSKHGALRFIGHLDVMRFFQKAIRRADIDVAYTTGYSPHQIMSFAAPLGVGLESNGEYLDIEVYSMTTCEDVKAALNQVMAEGIEILGVYRLAPDAPNAMASVAAASYTVRFVPGREPDIDIGAALSDFLDKEKIYITKEGKNGTREVDIRPGIYSCIWENNELHLLTDASSSGNIKPVFIIDALLGEYDIKLSPNSLLITREETYTDIGAAGERRLVPLGGMS